MLLLICLRDLPIYQEWDSGVLKRLTWFLQFSGLRSNYLQMFHKISRKTPVLESFSLHEKYPYSEFFWSVFSLNAVKYGPEKLPIRTLFSQCLWLISCHWSLSILRICRWSYNSDVSRGYRKSPVAWYGLKILQVLRTQIYWKIFGASVFL